MDVIRRNTDYALRAMTALAQNYPDRCLSVRRLSQNVDVSNLLLAKLLQKLQRAKFVKSSMGPNGGFTLNKPPKEISLKKIIEVIQGPIRLNRCDINIDPCPLKEKCPLRPKLAQLQNDIDRYFSDITLQELLSKKNTK